MPSKRIAFHDFDQRLWLSGGRDQIPQNALRRAVGVAPENTRSVQSRWGSTFLFPVNAISLFQYAGVRYAYDGVNLYANGVIVTFGGGGAITWNGTKLTFAVMPPQPGLPDYLFILGGGNALKIAPALVGGVAVPAAQKVTNWGINAPQNGMSAALGTQELITIDQFDGSGGFPLSNWTSAGSGENTNCTLSTDTAEPYQGTGDMKITIPANVGSAVHTSRAFNTSLATYADGTISLPTDIISFYFKCPKPSFIGYLKLIFNVGDATHLLTSPFTLKDYYELTAQIVQTTNQKSAAGAQVIVTPSASQWIQIAVAKSQFRKFGTNNNLDWSDVNGIRLVIGDLGDVTATHCNVDQLTMYGGSPLGAGPAALLGGSQYKYYVTFGNNTTGSDSNPNGMQLQADGTISQPSPAVVGAVVVQPIALTNIPVSTDAQVGNRKLWRTSAGGAIAFYLDTIPDNTTTTYTDVRSDLPGQPIIQTPWTKSVSYSSSVPDYIDGGDGFYFKCTTSGTSGATLPQWNIPTGPFLGFWSPVPMYLVGQWISYLGTGYVCLVNNQNVTPTSSLGIDWAALGTTADNTVVWTWAGLNEVPHLGTTQLRLDNAPPQVTYGDAVGPYQGSMFWCRDSVPGRRGWVYSSPPGRPESSANIIVATSDDDPTQKLAIFDFGLWLITTKAPFQGIGDNPLIVFNQIMSATGTSNPFSVVTHAQRGIYYQAPDGIRMIDRSGSQLPGFANIAPIQRKQAEENVNPFTAAIGAHCRNEIIFSDGTVSFGLQLDSDGFVWRMIGRGFGALYYERNDNEILASYGGSTVLFEDPGTVTDVSGGGANQLVTQVSVEVVMANH